jgi:N-acetylneuraminate 9-O-acetyltransferase
VQVAVAGLGKVQRRQGMAGKVERKICDSKEISSSFFLSQPFGCMIHRYSEQDTRRCNRLNAFLGKENRFLFIGDVRVKQLFDSFVSHFQPAEVSTSSVEYVDNMLKLRVNYIAAGELRKMLSEFERISKDAEQPNFIVASSKFINLNRSENFTKEVELNLTLLISPIDSLVRKQTRILWKLQDPIDDNTIEPAPEWKDVTNSDIERFNRIVSDTMKYSNVNVWRSGTQIAYGLIDEMTEGSKVSEVSRKTLHYIIHIPNIIHIPQSFLNFIHPARPNRPQTRHSNPPQHVLQRQHEL